MSLTLLVFSILTVCLFGLLFWALRSPGKANFPNANSKLAEPLGRQHLTYFPQIQRAILAEDCDFLASRGSAGLARRVRKERRALALRYLVCLRGEFMKLWRLARLLAAMSPRVAPMGEFERFRLGVTFNLRCELLRVKFVLGFSPVPDFQALSQAVSRLAIRMETAMSELGERAALASEVTSTFDRGGLGRS